ncbi:HYD1 signature containing ADP-ribosyltransferase family protein, partial [Streptomyces sp. NPDC099050]|uniref:HYD1 signature containing ADP-ribosyltransferase family protein n=1 Tax=Streptomyces sp. NPDC099050 TaxID=3366100 RepID=UPI00380E1BA0
LYLRHGLRRHGHVCHQVSLPGRRSTVDRTDPVTGLGFDLDSKDAAAGSIAALAIPIGVKAPNRPRTLYHYTTEDKMNQIIDSKELWASTLAARPKDAKLGDGQYLSDITPGTKRNGQLSRAFYGTPWHGKHFSHYVGIDVRGLPLVTAADRPGVFLVPNNGPLDISQRIREFGVN